MTPENRDEQSESTPVQPVTTRWSDGEPAEDAELLPPYLPGRPARPRPPGASQPGDDAAVPDTVEPGMASDPAASSPEDASAGPPPAEPEPVDVPAQAFPFDMAYPEEDPEDFPVGAFEIGRESAAPADQDEFPDRAGPFDEPPILLPRREPESPDPYGPLEAYEPAGREEADAGEWGAGGPEEEVALRLERLADALRRDGAAALERESREGDRLGSVLAGLLAGYLAGRGGPER